tara:strand:+ start:543 stop:1352 length:810 start_codon:yes stop_codon:yes gene_type:complete
MAYIGSQPTVGNFQACDAISVSATATFNLAVGSVAISPQSAQHCLVSLNGVLQAPISSYTISGSTIIFAAALTTDDVIDFITVMGDTLDLGQPSDGTVVPASMGTTAVTALTAGTGITNGTNTIYRSDVQKLGNILHTRILIDLTGLASSGNGDIIGKAGTANSHIGQITAAVNGTVLGGKITCFEAPAGGDPDINLWYADEATGAEDAAITSLTNQVQMCNSGDLAIGTVVGIPTPPAANKYLYMVTGAATNADYSAGKILIEFFGYV